MCTAFPYGRSRERRLQAEGINALSEFGSFGSGPWALRPKRLQWLKRFDFSKRSQNRPNIRAEFKIAAFSSGPRPSFFFQNSDPGQGLAGTHPSILFSTPESGLG